MKAVVFEDDALSGFGPLTLLRHASLLRLGTKSLLDALVERIPAPDVGLWGRQELAALTREQTTRSYNEKAYGSVLFINARARPTEALAGLAARADPFVAVDRGELVAARLDSGALNPGVIPSRGVARLARRLQKVEMPQDALFEGYWDLVQSNGLAIAEQAMRFRESKPIPRGVEVRGPASNVMLHPDADLEPHVTLDARLGPVVVESGAAVESFSRLMGPCYIGPKTRVYSALIGGGTSIFESCKAGGQLENSVMMPYSNKAHHGYMGDSYVGSWVNLGAGSTFSNLKNTYGNVRLSLGGATVDSGMLKLGPVVGDMAKLSIGALVYAGRSIGAGSHVSGLAGSDVPSFTFFDSNSGGAVELLVDSVVETQRRMMERRGLTLGRSEESLIRRAFSSTAAERKKAGVRKGALR